MDIGELTDETLRDLRRERPYPAVSLLLPTTRRAPTSTEDQVRLRNTVAEAKRRLADDPRASRSARIDVEAQIDAAVREVDLAHSSDGLLILAAPGEHQVWYLPRTVPQRVVVSDTFLTRNLVAARLSEEPYWVLVLSESETRLWDGAGDHLVETIGHGFPVRPSLPDHEDALPGANFDKVGNHATTAREEAHVERERQYTRTVVGALMPVLDREPRPLYVVGLREQIALLEKLCPRPGAITSRTEQGGAIGLSAHALAEVLRPAFEERRAARQGEVLRRLSDARGQKRFTSGLDEIWQTVRQGRVALLAVEDHYQITARVDGNGGHPVRLEEPAEPLTADPAIREDVVDEIVEAALDNGADVEFVRDDTLAEEDRLAAVLRY
ncbi:baeRF3 domain-containing protein [Streptomyces sp. L500]|uniref:baeRF3 domain-containing protein n=1 Tax=Streptomyces abikoensis TaxID=97398 RepID=UPI003687430C